MVIAQKFVYIHQSETGQTIATSSIGEAYLRQFSLMSFRRFHLVDLTIKPITIDIKKSNKRYFCRQIPNRALDPG